MAFSSLRNRFLGKSTPSADNPVPESDNPVPVFEKSSGETAPEADAIGNGSTLSSGEVIFDSEKGPVIIGREGSDSDEPFADDDPVLRDIPPHVRRIVSLTDDPTLPTLTFRYFILAIFFVAPGAFVSQLSSYRTTYAPYSVFFVQILSNYLGLWLAKILPEKTIRLPFTKYGFSLNPGPWNSKEHVLVTISAASGATYNLAYGPISMAELYFGIRINPAVAIFFMWAVVWVGYSYAAIARQFLLYDPQYPWFSALCQTALFETQKKQNANPTRVSRKQMKVFFFSLAFITSWQFLPEFIFPMLGSMAFLCWVAPRNATANFLGSGFGGMGLLNLSFDWSNLSNLSNSGSLFVTPWWTQVNIFLAYVVACFILIPAAKWGGLGQWNHKLMSNRLFTVDAEPYPILELMTPQATFNETAYAEHGQIYVGTQVLWSMFFDYASYSSGVVWLLCFGYPTIKATIDKLRARRRAGGKETINHQYDDQLNILQRSYEEVPWWWYASLFLASFVIIITCVATGQLFIPVFTVFVALATGAVMVIPLGWLYAVSNYQLAIGTVNELLYGLMVNAVNGNHNPCGATVYSSIAGDAWYRAQLMLQDQKIGHYMHVPQRAVFFSQLFGSFIGIPINYAVIRWAVKTKAEYLNGSKTDPTHQWTGQSLSSTLTTSVQYVLIGPKRLFQESLFHPVPYGFLVGAIAPIIIFGLHRLFPRAKFQLWNSTIFFAGLSSFYGNISTGYFSSIIGGFVVMFWAYRYRYNMWARYNYLLAAAFDAGYNLNLLLIFLFFGAGKVVTMPYWWGNNEDSSDRCFALDKSA
ncbi:hypothetical protein V502_01571 [Pseudogymnoascus sp. VKM F-4520 (FW-2644)]|nr:hypothetical protein V502_01571 [Pseudogymnoascus sp. VKM F-4520 (FW-2644)]